jgi:hypothetical protein
MSAGSTATQWYVIATLIRATNTAGVQFCRRGGGEDQHVSNYTDQKRDAKEHACAAYNSAAHLKQGGRGHGSQCLRIALKNTVWRHGNEH